MDGDGRVNAVDRDTDGDLVLNADDADIDGDGIANAIIDCLPDGTEVPRALDPDMDGDGLLNELDPDADGDGINDPGDPDRWGARAVLGRMLNNTFERRAAALLIAGPAEAAPDALVEYRVTLAGLAGRTVVLTVTNAAFEVVGAVYTAVTDADGVALLRLHPAFARTADWRVDARFAGDGWYAGSQTKRRW